MITHSYLAGVKHERDWKYLYKFPCSSEINEQSFSNPLHWSFIKFNTAYASDI